MNTAQQDPKDLQAVLKVNGYTPFETKHLNIVDVIPDELDFIWDSFSDDCPFSFGDNNYTLVDALTIRNWVRNCYDLCIDGDISPASQKKAEKAIDKFTELMNLCFHAQVYINVE
jgi:hypothetical protein